jgi:hyperosmotically inducible protein
MRYAILFAIALGAAGCEAQATPKDRPSENTKVAEAPADNTKKNERDRGSEALTPGDQGTSEADRTITQRIRQGVVKSDALSMTGKNVKIITVNGVVTLRGPVKTDEEKTQIAALAQSVDGVTRVDNQLEIAAK